MRLLRQKPELLRAVRRMTAALAMSAVLGQSEEAAAQVPTLMQQASASRARGNPDAPVLIYEITDLQCPYCASFARTVFPRIDSVYVRSGKVQWVFVNLPLPSHARAWSAAEAALCAGGVAGKFWTYKQRLFNGRQEWSTSAEPSEWFVRYAREAGIAAEPFLDCIVEDRLAPLLLEDLLFAAMAGVSGTPTFIIHPDQKVVGLKSFEEWQMLIEAALRRDRPLR